MNKDKRVEMIMAFENGELEFNEILKLFSDLIKTGLCWKLQGSYGRSAEMLIAKRYLNKDGKILNKEVGE